jgi:hypothetical protein
MPSISECPETVRRRVAGCLCAVATVLTAAVTVLAGCATARTSVVAADDAQQCPEPYPAHRDPANPLHLRRAPGANPLTGARFFVPGPAKGVAARAIAQLVGLNPDTMPVNESWATFSRKLAFGPLHNALVASRGLARQVALLSKVASQPEAQRISSYSWGGTPAGIFNQTQKVLCHNMTADRGSIPILSTDFLHATLGGSPMPAQMSAYRPLFRARVDAMAQAIDGRPAVLLLEIDGIGSTRGVVRMGSLPAWEADLRYEINTMAALPHTVVYVEGGYSDSNSVRYTARVLNAIGVNRIRGFFTNDTHEAWTIKEVRWATAIAKRTQGARFIVDTADNGRGPLLNRVKVGNGIEDLCNPPRRGLGPRDTTDTGYAYADAWMWTHPPGNSSGCGGGPPGGVFGPTRAEAEAARADAQLGPGLPSHPY